MEVRLEQRAKEIQDLIDRTVAQDKEVAGLLVYHQETDEIVATTYDENKAKKVVVVRKKYAKLGDEVVEEGIFPSGKWNWGLTSVARYTTFATNLVGDYVLAGEFTESKAPSACIEDALELSLMINDIFE